MSSIAITPRSYTAPARPVVRASGATAPRLRLTRRGRVVLAALVTLPLVIAVLVLSLNGGAATATLEGSTVPFEYVTVESGQSLWDVAEVLAPSADPREVIDAIVRLNGLESVDVYAGQELAIPAVYAH